MFAGNLLIGLPFQFDSDLRVSYSGSLFSLLHPFALLCGVIAVLMATLHGAIYLQWRVKGVIRRRALAYIKIAGRLTIIALLLVFVWAALGIDGYRIVEMAGTNAPSNPLLKTVETVDLGWGHNAMARPWLVSLPVTAVLTIAIAIYFSSQKLARVALTSSAVGISSTLFTLGLILFPFILPSSIDPNSSLTIWDASASHFTLQLTFWISIILLPIVITYTRWVYKVIWIKPLEEEDIQRDQHKLY